LGYFPQLLVLGPDTFANQTLRGPPNQFSDKPTNPIFADNVVLMEQTVSWREPSPCSEATHWAGLFLEWFKMTPTAAALLLVLYGPFIISCFITVRITFTRVLNFIDCPLLPQAGADI
jgi:hypothetical protein